MSDVLTGPLWPARNWSADEGAGSIHDDTTAANLGFRGGTVAGDVHMNQFPPVLVKIFGQAWFEHGNLSLKFVNATVDQEKVRVFAEPLQPGQHQVNVWMEREDGLLVCRGTAAVGDHGQSELRAKDLRPCDPAELRIMSKLYPGMSLGTYSVQADTEKQFRRFDTQVISDPLDWYRTASPWGTVVAAPCTVLEYLWAYPIRGLLPYVEDAVGLFGAIEIGFEQGPMLMNRPYTLSGEVVCVGQSPQTEYVWFDTQACDGDGRVVARMRMQSRSMKASSHLYADAR